MFVALEMSVTAVRPTNHSFTECDKSYSKRISISYRTMILVSINLFQKKTWYGKHGTIFCFKQIISIAW